MEKFDTVACCGLFCETCSVFIASRGDEKALETLAVKMNTTKEELRCKGCRTDQLSIHCRNCEFRNCTQKNGIQNCEECSEFPCGKLQEFKAKMPHRIELFESANYRKEHGVIKWKEKMKDDYACKACGTINSPYFLKCKSCGQFPGNDYITRNISEIKKYLKI